MIQKKIQPDDGILVARNLHKKFGDNVVLDNVSLAIEEGKTTVIIGPSGCGKTVFMKHLIVLERPDAGDVYYRGQRIDNLSGRQLVPIRKKFAKASQRLFISVRTNLLRLFAT